MNIRDYLSPIDKTEKKHYFDSQFVSQHVTFWTEKKAFPSKEIYHVAVIGVPDNQTDKKFVAASKIRQQLYNLSIVNKCNIIDLGNIKVGNSFNDTCFAIRDVISMVNSYKCIVLLLGGDSSYNFGTYMAYNQKAVPLNMVSVDSTITNEKIPILKASQLVLTDAHKLSAHFNFINIGYQSYFVERKMLNYIDDSRFEAYRLGHVRSNLKEMEPVLRDSNLVSFSLNAVKFSDAPGVTSSSPNGLTGDEACQLSFFTGYSTRLQTFGLFDYAPQNDIQDTTAKLAAQLLWYFLEGFSNALFEEPDVTPENFTKYHIQNDQTQHNIVFYKSNLTNRWWMEIHYPDQKRNIMFSCSQSDYDAACRQEVPERWWRLARRIIS